MKLLQLSLSNFCGWAKLDLDLSAYSGVVGILGAIDGDISHSNGSGKSSLVTAIIFALYGKQIVKNMDEFIMQGKESDGFRVSLKFEYEGTVYEVIRKKRANSQQRVQLKNISSDTIIPGEPEGILKMPLAVWNNTVYSEQGRLAGFVDQSPSTRKDILTEIFGMRRYLQLEAKARESHSEAAAAVLRATGEVDQLKLRVLQLSTPFTDISVLTGQLTQADEACSVATAGLSETRAAIASNGAKLEQASTISKSLAAIREDQQKLSRRESLAIATYGDDLRNRTKDIKSIETKLSDLKNLPDVESLRSDLAARLLDRDKLQVLLSSAESLKLDIAKSESEVKLYLNEVSHVDRKISAFSALGAKCPTCGTDLDPSHKDSHLTEFKTSKQTLEQQVASSRESICNNYIKLHSIEGEITELSALVNSIPILESHILRTKSAVSDREYLSTLHADAQTRLSEIKQRHMQDLSDISETRASLNSKEQELKAAQTAFSDIVAATSLLEKKLTEQEAEVKRVSNLRDSISTRLHKLEALKETLESATLELAAAESRLATLSRRQFIANELVKSFGPTGIPTLILENCLSELQSYLDSYMDLLSDGKIKVTFKTTKTSSTTGKSSETLAIMVSDINGERDILRYSGGERVRVYLAIRLALAKLMEHKSGTKIGFLIIDEISDLDDSGLSAFIQLLKTVDSEFGQIFLVSHLPELKNAFSGSLVLSRDLYGNHTK